MGPASDADWLETGNSCMMKITGPDQLTAHTDPLEHSTDQQLHPCRSHYCVCTEEASDESLPDKDISWCHHVAMVHVTCKISSTDRAGC